MYQIGPKSFSHILHNSAISLNIFVPFKIYKRERKIDMRLHSCTHFVQVKLGTVWD